MRKSWIRNCVGTSPTIIQPRKIDTLDFGLWNKLHDFTLNPLSPANIGTLCFWASEQDLCLTNVRDLLDPPIKNGSLINELQVANTNALMVPCLPRKQANKIFSKFLPR